MGFDTQRSVKPINFLVFHVSGCTAAPSVTSTGTAQQPLYSYVLAPQDLNPGDTIQSGARAPIKPGNTLPLKDIPVGMPINSIELHPNQGGQLCRAAGCMATIVNKQQEHAIVRLPSGGVWLVDGPLVCVYSPSAHCAC
jgi:ribosomal protein L2